MNEACHIRMSHVTYEWILHHTITHFLPTQEIKFKIFGSPDYMFFLYNQLSDGDSRLLAWKLIWYFGESRENLFESYEDSRENSFEFFWQPYLFKVRSPPSGTSYSWGMSRTNESCLPWMGHGSYEQVMSRVNESCDVWVRDVLHHCTP